MKLTVGIPTYRRPQFLEKCIRSVLASIGERDVEVLVCDDSIDRTNDVVYAAMADPRLRVVRNERNLGIDANICACVERAEGEYVWLIGEDDLMRRQGISAVLKFLENSRQDYPFVFANYSYTSSDQLREFQHRSIDADVPEMLFSEFFENYLWSAGFIGGCIIRRQPFLATTYKEFIGTYYAHVAGIALASVGKRIGLIAEPLIGNRVGNADTFTWSGDSFGVFQGWRLLLQRLRGALGESSYQAAYRSHTRAHGYLGYKFLIAKKADGLLAQDNISGLLKGDVSPAERRRIQIVSLLIPASICRSLRTAYAALRKSSLARFNLG